MKREFSPDEIKMLIDRYPHVRTDKLAKEMGRPIFSIYNKAHSMHLRKTKKFLTSSESGIMIKGDTRGMATRFRKGQIPPNKGKKMPKELYEKCAATMFKKGHKPHNTKVNGFLSLRKDKNGRSYIYIRVSEGKWELYHRVIWKQHHGKLPDGYNVVFKDGNSGNLGISNLEMLSDADLMLRNSWHSYPEDLQKLIQIKRVLQCQINKQLKKDE